MRIFGIEVSRKSVALSVVHTVVETATMISWLALALNNRPALAIAVLAAGLTLEHILALAAGKAA